MEDEYNVKVTLTSETTGGEFSTDEKVVIEFDATDATYEVVLEKVELLLKAMGYVFDGRRVGMIDEGTGKPAVLNTFTVHV
jgi:hypothetical protein